jgi:tripeptide aminopeptidase
MKKVLSLLLLVLAYSNAQVSNNPQVKRAIEFIKQNEAETVNEQAKICEIPAPSFKEQVRAAYLKQRFIELGLINVRIDAEGNVLGERPGETAQTTLVLAAHLDTVFPEGTDVKVSRSGTTLKAPGIGDDTRGLAVLLAVVRAMNDAKISTRGTIIFVANVGEEGLGDLRGTRYLFNKELKGKITHFVSVDGTGHGTTNRAVGSNRYRVTFRGPGGHSYGAFGMTNPIHALGRAIEKISRFKVPSQPKTTFNVGRIEGGTSVNSIAYEAWMEMDMRSESPTALATVDSSFKRAVQQALDEENAFWTSPTKLTVEVKLVGERLTGEQSADAPIVRVAMAVDSSLGIRTRLNASSTDSNVPISLGIPAITIGGGGQGRGAHSPGESFDSTDSYLGTQRVLLIALGVVGVK